MESLSYLFWMIVNLATRKDGLWRRLDQKDLLTFELGFSVTPHKTDGNILQIEVIHSCRSLHSVIVVVLPITNTIWGGEVRLGEGEIALRQEY